MQYTCPRRPIYENPSFYSDLFWVYSNYKLGILPDAGSLLEQSYKLMFFIRHIDSIIDECNKEREEKAKKSRSPMNKAAKRTRF